MSRFLFTTLFSNDLGLLTRSVPVAVELAARGHQVAFCNPATAPRRLIAEAGLENRLPDHPLFQLVQLDAGTRLRELVRILTSPSARQFGNPLSFLIWLARIAPVPTWQDPQELANMDGFWALLGLRNEHYIRAQCDAMIELLGDYRPDAVVDALNPFAGIAARALRIPLVTLIQGDTHPASGGFIWWREAHSRCPSPLPAINRVMAGYGLAPLTNSAELNVGTKTLVVNIPELDPLPPSANVTYVGPVLWQKPGAVLPDWLDALNPAQPLIWVYLGNPQYFPVRTPMDSILCLSAIIQALADQPVQVVLTTGHNPLPRSLTPLPANFHHAPYLPGLDLARRSQLLIHHGGYGSSQTALLAGTPALILPNYSERESNARRVAAVGAAEVLAPPRDWNRNKQSFKEEICGQVNRMLRDPSYAENARRIRDKMQAYGGAAWTATEIEECL